MMICRPASQISADPVVRKFPEFMNASSNSDGPVVFTGEMVKACIDL